MANKRRTNTRTQLSTFGTELGSVVRSNLNKFNSFPFSFVLDETLQLEETPITYPIIHSPSEISSSNPLEIFHYNLASIKIINNLFADVMINPSHETTFFSRELFEKPSGTSSAFALEFTSQEFEFPFNLIDLRGVKELFVRSNSKIINPQVHTENSVRTRTNGAFLGECEQEEAFTFGINPQKAFINFPTEIIFVTIRNSERNFNPSFDCRDAQNIIFEREASWSIVSDGTKFNKRFSFSFLDKPASLFNTRDSELRGQSNFFERGINKRMEFDIVSNSHFPSLVNTELHPFFIDCNSINNFLSWFNFNFSCCPDSHKNYKDSDYLNLMEGISPPKAKAMGIRNATFI